MISRYEDQEISAVFAGMPALWGEVLAAWAPTHEARRRTQVAAMSVVESPTFAADMAACEAVTRHDLAAFLDLVHDEGVHVRTTLATGLTSSDVVDTALSIAMNRAGDVVASRLGTLRGAMAARALTHARTPCAGRTHGRLADVTTFGLRLAGMAVSLDAALPLCRMPGMFSGPVGTHTHAPYGRAVEACRRLGLEHAIYTSQVVPRILHAAAISRLHLATTAMAGIALQLRLMHQDGVGEVRFPNRRGQKGSSSMPHKENPAPLEKVCGLARLADGYAAAAHANAQLWGERDISHSSVEREAIPGMYHVACHQATTLTAAIDAMEVDEEAMEAAAAACPQSHRVLCEAMAAGISRQRAYESARPAPPYGLQGVGQWVRAYGRGVEEAIVRMLGGSRWEDDAI